MPATRTPYGLYFILLNVDGHRFAAALWTGQNVIGRIFVARIHRMIEFPHRAWVKLRFRTEYEFDGI
jgi:hypothetical protein